MSPTPSWPVHNHLPAAPPPHCPVAYSLPPTHELRLAWCLNADSSRPSPPHPSITFLCPLPCKVQQASCQFTIRLSLLAAALTLHRLIFSPLSPPPPVSCSVPTESLSAPSLLRLHCHSTHCVHPSRARCHETLANCSPPCAVWVFVKVQPKGSSKSG